MIGAVMDKLRAMQYLVQVVRAGGFAAAARELDVSPPAVTKSIAALERTFGVQLLRRDSRHVSLTADGELFVPICVRTLKDLQDAEETLSATKARASGKLVVGMSSIIAQHCVVPFLAEFSARHPQLNLDLRIVHELTEPNAALSDVLVLIGWLEERRLIAKRVAQTRFLTCASPTYWKSRGLPKEPDDLHKHNCLAYRLPRGLVLDLWKYQRAGQVRDVAVQSRIISSDRDWMLEVALGGGGVVRVVDLTVRKFIEDGLLEPVLQDWEALEAPPIYLLYRRGARSTARARAFTDFIIGLFADLEASRPLGPYAKTDTAPKPAWHRSRRVGSNARLASAKREIMEKATQ